MPLEATNEYDAVKLLRDVTTHRCRFDAAPAWTVAQRRKANIARRAMNNLPLARNGMAIGHEADTRTYGFMKGNLSAHELRLKH